MDSSNNSSAATLLLHTAAMLQGLARPAIAVPQKLLM
jgi:hypothetical protein